MLWNKCPIYKNVYVELWPKERKRVSDSTEIFPKSNEESRNFRLAGNTLFQNNDFEKALMKYNKSICIAENGSPELALGYANRGMCFYRMKLYSNCLKDIQLAREANTPESLIAIVEHRSRKCMERLKTNDEEQVEAQLSFTANEKIPGMADCFRVEKDDNFGTRVIATKGLEIGQNILIEEPCLQHMCDGPLRRCNNCYKEYMNLMPCKSCIKGMFCSEACMQNNCEANQSKICIDDCLTETFRSVLLALKAYPNVEDLMKATEEIRLRSQLWDEVQDYMKSPSPQTTYRLFFSRGVKNAYLLNDWTPKNIQDQLSHYHRIMKNPKMANIFSSLASQRFLQHLLLHHVLVITGCKGIFGLYEDEKHPPETPISQHLSRMYAVAHYPITNMFNHSCAPNVFLISLDYKVVLKIVQAVKSGEELFVPYFTICKRTEPSEERHQQLDELGWRLPQHQCKCNLCQNEGAQDQMLEDMSIVEKLTDLIERPPRNVTRAEAIAFIQRAIAYLNENNINHPSFNTLTAQNGLFIFWHLFPALI